MSVCNIILILDEYKLVCVRKPLDSIAKRMPLGKLVMAPCVVYVYKHLVVEADGTHLVEGRGKKLDYVMPMAPVLRIVELHPLVLEEGNELIKHAQSLGGKSVTGKVLAGKFLGVDLMHSRG